ncbi:substrate-binding domain-containing protein [Maricaulaceae bacterium EIL42A08]|nr:substrate-binding domain-containing protein [Maricaulaceae bacterium EIL42A08]
MRLTCQNIGFAALLILLSACEEPAEEVVLAPPGEVVTPLEEAGLVEQNLVATGRETLRVVGSSTVFPFVTTAAENFGAGSGFPAPLVEATGTGGGMNLFCAGLGLTYPDFTAASRRIKPSEFQLCQENGVTQIVEILIGFDGIVLGNSVDAEPMDIAKRDLFLALAARIPMPVNGEGRPVLSADGRLISDSSFSQVAGYDCNTLIDNPYRRWADINPQLPVSRIEVFGPPPTSGTRDAFVELDMLEGARQLTCLGELERSSPQQFEQIAARIREDGAWVDSGENDNSVVQTLSNAPSAFGIFGFSFLEQNGDRIQAARLDGIEPTYDNISNGIYPSSRSLYVYAKAQHQGVKPGFLEFVEELTREDAWGPFGYMADRGLIALPEARRMETAETVRDLTAMQIPR